MAEQPPPPTTFRQKTAQLEQSIAKTSQTLKAKERCFPTMLIAAAVFPLIIFGILFFWQPSIVQRKEGSKNVRDNKKVFYWTLGLTVLVWAGMYGYSYWAGHRVSMLCPK